jgi:hypothetical protein
VDSLFEYPMGEMAFKLNDKILLLFLQDIKIGLPPVRDKYIISKKGNKIALVKQKITGH